jgi:hypothetical protein
MDTLYHVATAMLFLVFNLCPFLTLFSALDTSPPQYPTPTTPTRMELPRRNNLHPRTQPHVRHHSSLISPPNNRTVLTHLHGSTIHQPLRTRSARYDQRSSVAGTPRVIDDGCILVKNGEEFGLDGGKATRDVLVVGCYDGVLCYVLWMEEGG